MSPAIKQEKETIAQFIERINESTSLKLLDEADSVVKITPFTIIFRVLKATLSSLIIQKGYKKGLDGFITARLAGIAALIKFTKIWEYKMRIEEGKGLIPPTAVEQIKKYKPKYL
jgi:hypothetical protein